MGVRRGGGDFSGINMGLAHRVSCCVSTVKPEFGNQQL
jgi:hypothetical protein